MLDRPLTVAHPAGASVPPSTPPQPGAVAPCVSPVRSAGPVGSRDDEMADRRFVRGVLLSRRVQHKVIDTVELLTSEVVTTPSSTAGPVPGWSSR